MSVLAKGSDFYQFEKEMFNQNNTAAMTAGLRPIWAGRGARGEQLGRTPAWHPKAKAPVAAMGPQKQWPGFHDGWETHKWRSLGVTAPSLAWRAASLRTSSGPTLGHRNYLTLGCGPWSPRLGGASRSPWESPGQTVLWPGAWWVSSGEDEAPPFLLVYFHYKCEKCGSFLCF